MDNKTRRRRRVAVSVLTACTVMAASPGLAAAADPLPNPLEPIDTLAVTESGGVTPLAPGVAGGTHFTLPISAPTGTANGFAKVTDGGMDFLVEEIGVDGVVESSTIELAGGIESSYIVDVVTDEFLALRAIEFNFVGGPITRTSLALVDRATGSVAVLGTTDGEVDPMQVSDDGRTFSGWGGDEVPFAMRFDGLVDESYTFDDTGLNLADLTPEVSPDGGTAALAGWSDAADGGELVLRSLDDAATETRIALPCGTFSCEYEVHDFSSWGPSGTVYLTAFDLVAGPASLERVVARHYAVDVATSTVTASEPVMVASASGRYGVGNSATGTDVDLSSTELTILDAKTARTRTVVFNLPSSYMVYPLAVSDDGLTIRYRADVACTGVCVVQPAFFGEVQLLPVADVTRGPAEDQILRLYRAAFGRIPDPGGFEFWVDRYRNGETLLDIAEGFARSPEFDDNFGQDLTNAELVDGLYMNVLGRSGDPEGAEFWVALREHGITMGELLVGFSDSDENIERTGTRQPLGTVEGRVLRLYRAVLGREPDDDGLTFWADRYNRGLAIVEMARQFTGQPEYAALYGADPTDAELVDAVYRNVLGRPGDAGGVEFWNDRMADGLTVPELFVAFANSPENIERTGTVR